MSAELDEVIKQAETLSPEEQLRLATLLIEKARSVDASATRKRKWAEIAGAAPNLLQGEDAQAWITRTRQEADLARERQ